MSSKVFTALSKTKDKTKIVMMRLLRCWIGVSGQEGKTANDKDKYKDKKITKTKTKTQRKTRIVMMRQQCQIAGRGSWKEKGGLLD